MKPVTYPPTMAMPSVMSKKRNWYAGNNAYNNGMNSFFKKRNWYAGNNAYNNGMNSFF